MDVDISRDEFSGNLLDAVLMEEGGDSDGVLLDGEDCNVRTQTCDVAMSCELLHPVSQQLYQTGQEDSGSKEASQEKHENEPNVEDPVEQPKKEGSTETASPPITDSRIETAAEANGKAEPENDISKNAAVANKRKLSQDDTATKKIKSEEGGTAAGSKETVREESEEADVNMARGVPEASYASSLQEDLTPPADDTATQDITATDGSLTAFASIKKECSDGEGLTPEQAEQTEQAAGADDASKTADATDKAETDEEASNTEEEEELEAGLVGEVLNMLNETTMVPTDVLRLTGKHVSSDRGDEVMMLKGMADELYRQIERVPRAMLLDSLTLESFASYLKTCKNVIIMCGAGISVAAGIPDFRTPGTGLYSQLGKYNLPEPEAMFNLRYFKKRPFAFYKFAEELWPGKYKPTNVHRMMTTFQEKGILQRVYTQNIDGLERLGGVSADLLVEAHGHMSFAHCIDCNKPFSSSFVKNKLDTGVLPLCPCCRTVRVPIPILDVDETPSMDPMSQAVSQDLYKMDPCDLSLLPDIKGLVKPRIVFFHESLPAKYTDNCEPDFAKADALLIIGTSLKVEPFCFLPQLTSASCPRLLINRDTQDVGARAGFVTSKKYGYRDVVVDGDCQEGAKMLLDALGWPLTEETRTSTGMPPPTAPDLSVLSGSPGS
eukprot:TRINITY_DN5533_c0_g3_i3.p2 TRINITY_DN5533_c0_g3~~TRINITY_DN5533_c0_g3_i3.p2  ORF type:complete len:665 (+),score=146.26 TRINITY_DN5533_c0_g3_i3:2689-4683(+)